MIWGLGSSFLLLFALVYQNWKRSQISEVQELIPNCLLTSYPLVFIPGKRSLFYFLGYWNQIPHWLASHGYEVFHLHLPWQNSQKRMKSLIQMLDHKSSLGEKFHLFLDESSLLEVHKILLNGDFECLASVTLIGKFENTGLELSSRLSIPVEEVELPQSTGPASPLFWLLHQLWTSQKVSLNQLGWNLNRQQGQILLQRAQFLAERDLLQKQRSPNLKA